MRGGHQSVSQSASQPVSQSASQSASQSVSQSVSRQSVASQSSLSVKSVSQSSQSLSQARLSVSPSSQSLSQSVSQSVRLAANAYLKQLRFLPSTMRSTLCRRASSSSELTTSGHRFLTILQKRQARKHQSSQSIRTFANLQPLQPNTHAGRQLSTSQIRTALSERARLTCG